MFFVFLVSKLPESGLAAHQQLAVTLYDIQGLLFLKLAQIINIITDQLTSFFDPPCM